MKRYIFLGFASMLAAIISGCADNELNEQEAFWNAIQSHCGKAYAGKLVSDDEVDNDLAGQPMIMHVAHCSETETQIPFLIGENRSRTWFLTKQGEGLRLKHRHNHEDGHEDSVSQYGGDTGMPGQTTRQEFPVDEFSKTLFAKEGLNVSVTNIWAMEITDEIFAYELNRENRHFRVEFDLNSELDQPLPPW